MNVDSPVRSGAMEDGDVEDFGDFSSLGGVSGQQQQQQQRQGDHEEDEDDEEEDEEDEEEAQGPARKKRKKRSGVNRFIDVEAEVDEDDEEDVDEEDMAAHADFIVPGIGADDDEGTTEDAVSADRQNRKFERSQRREDDRSAQQIAREIEERERARRAHARDVDEMGAGPIPKHALAPDVNDPTIWAVKVRPGKERDLVFSICKKALADQHIRINSAFQRDSIKGFIYIEARSEAYVRNAIHGLVGVFGSSQPLLIPLEDRMALLKTKQIVQELQIGGWVRFKRGKHTGDIGQIIDVPDNGDQVTVKFIPRIDFAKREETVAADDGSNSKKRKKGPVNYNLPGMKPPQQLFNADDVRAAFGDKSVSYARGSFHFENDEYKDGFCIKDIRVSALNTEDIQPSLDEINQFDQTEKKASGMDDDDDAPPAESTTDNINFQLIAQAAKRSATAALQPGDHVQVVEGGSQGLSGTVVSIVNEKVFITSEEIQELREIEVLLSEVRKMFRVGDHVRVLVGAHTGQTGLVLSTQGDTLNFLSDLTGQEIQVFSKDVREAAEVGSTSNTVGQYELHDLVQLDQQTAGCIFKIEQDVLKIIDQGRTVRTLRPSQILGKVPAQRRSVATDADGTAINKGDRMKEVSGAMAGRAEPRAGQVLHTYKSLFAFLYNRDYTENGGVFVVYAQQLSSETLRSKPGQQAAARDPSKMNPDAQLMPPPSLAVAGAMGKAGRDRLVGQRIKIGGPGGLKGKEGRVKDVNPTSQVCRIELTATNKIVTVHKSKCMMVVDGKMRPAEEVLAESHKGNFNRGGSGPREGGHRNPPSGGRSSNPYMDALNSASGPAGGKTSNPYASSGGRTANPYYASSGKTPNPLVTGSGTAWGGGTAYGGSTQYNGDTWDSGSQTPALGGATGGADFGAGQDDGGRTSYAGQGYNSAPTPSANWNSQRPSAPPQQANFQSAPTPWGPPQPQSAPTPAAGYGHAAQTPAAPPSAPTPATNQPYSAPTPAAGGSYVNPERARQMASFQPPVDEAPSPAFEPSYESRQPASRHPRDRQQTGSNTGSLGAPNRWGAAKAQQQAYDAPTPAAGAPTPAAPPASAPTPGIFSAPTPGGYSAPTPGAGALGAPTPAPGRLSARTPAVVGSAATPYIPNAYTPAPGASHHDDPLSPVRSEQGLPWDWPKQGMRVRIRPSPDGESFEDGQFDGREARIETANADWESKDVVCSVLLPSHQTLDGFTSPFLEPIRPEFGDNCIVMSGPLRDQMAKCLTHNDDESLIEFTNKSTESVLTYLICAC